MAIDMQTLFSTTFGDPDQKLSVKRSWLKEVYSLLKDRERLLLENDALRAQLKAHQDLEELTEHMESKEYEAGWAQFDKGMNTIFGRGGAFDKIFGKKRRIG